MNHQRGSLPDLCGVAALGGKPPAAARRFCSWWEGQAADGFGESLEQREIQSAEFGGILVYFWDDSDDWRIQTEMQESSPDTGFEEEEVLEMEDIGMGGMV